ncbi:hypothetical protein IAT40_001184 [Kwoniella sp. CBS 6097]
MSSTGAGSRGPTTGASQAVHPRHPLSRPDGGLNSTAQTYGYGPASSGPRPRDSFAEDTEVTSGLQPQHSVPPTTDSPISTARPSVSYGHPPPFPPTSSHAATPWTPSAPDTTHHVSRTAENGFTHHNTYNQHSDAPDSSPASRRQYRDETRTLAARYLNPAAVSINSSAVPFVSTSPSFKPGDMTEDYERALEEGRNRTRAMPTPSEYA